MDFTHFTMKMEMLLIRPRSKKEIFFKWRATVLC